MTTDRSALDRLSAGGLRQAWNRFWFTPVEASQLHRLRVLAGLLFLAWIVAFAGNHFAFFSL